MRWSKFRTLTQGVVKHGAAAISQTVPAQGQIGKLLRKLADEQPAPIQNTGRVYEPRARSNDNPRWSEEGEWARAGRRLDSPLAPAGAPWSIGDTVAAPPSPAARAANDAHGALAALAAALPDAPPQGLADELEIGAVIAERYEILRAIGHGPAFRAYAARHRAWDIDVAIKVPRTDAPGLGMVPPHDLVADALRWTALGLHPHVVYCHYVDRLGGLPLLIVEHRAGGTLRPWIASGRTANLRIGLNLAIQICHGLERAHEEGLWHGGLRPEELLFDADDTLAVGDFGIASAAMLVRAESDGAAAARRRELEPYVAPEQWVDPSAIDARTDIFALGVCLYEMFTGRRPYDLARGPRREPPEPSAHGGALPLRLATLLRRCVDWEPGHRPAEVREIRAELSAAHEALFRRPSPFVALPASSGTADGWNNQAAALLLLGRPDEADMAWAQALATDPAHLEATYNLGMLRWSSAQISDAALRAAVARAAARHRGAPVAAVVLAELHLRTGDAAAAIACLEDIGADALDDAGRALLESARRGRGTTAGLAATWSGHRGYVAGVQLLAGGHRALSASDDGTVALWAAGQPAPLRVLEGHRGAVVALALSADGETAISGGDDATLRVWELKSGRCLKRLSVSGKVVSLGATADLTRAVVACSGADNFVGVEATTLFAWDLERDRPLGELKGHIGAAKCVALSGDGRLAASGGDDHTVRLWDVAQGGGCRRILAGHEHYVSAVCLHSDAELAVSGSWDTTLRVWDTRTGRCLRVMRGHEGVVNALALNADASLLVSAGWDRTVRVWDVKTGRCLRTFTGHEGIVSSVALSADGSMAASGSWDRTVRLWRVPPRSAEGFAPRLARRVASPRLPSGEPEPGELLDCAEVALREQRMADALDAVRAARTKAASADASRATRLWAELARVCRHSGVRTLQPLARWSAPSPLSAVRVARHGRCAVEALRGGGLRVWDAERAQAAQTLAGHEGRALAIALSDDDRTAVSAGADATVRVWDVEAGRCLHSLGGHSSLVAAVALTPDARWALSGSYDHTLRLWDIHRGRCERIFRGHARQVTAVALDAERGGAVSGDYAGSIHVWDLAAGRCLRRLVGHRTAVTALRLSPDGAWLLSASADRTLRLWRMATGECATVLEGASAALLDADCSRDLHWALAVARDGQAHLWDLHSGRHAGVFPLAQSPVDCASVDFDGGRVAAATSAGCVELCEVEWELEIPL